MAWFPYRAPSALLVAMFTFVLCGCGESTTPAVDSASTQPQTLLVPGTVQPSPVVPLQSPMAGTLVQVACREGDFVKKGQVLFGFDNQALLARLRRVQQAKTVAAAELESVRASSRSDATQGADFEKGKTAVAAAQAEVDADRAGIEYLQLLIEEAVVRSPAGGRIESLKAAAGDHFPAAGVILGSLRLLHPVYVKVVVGAGQRLSVEGWFSTGTQVDCYPDGATGKLSRGTITEISRDPKTSALQVSAAFDNPDNFLQPGQSVVVSLQSNQKN